MLRQFVLSCWYFVLFCDETAITRRSWGKFDTSHFLSQASHVLRLVEPPREEPSTNPIYLSTYIPLRCKFQSDKLYKPDTICLDLIPTLLWKIQPALFVKLYKPCTISQLGTPSSTNTPLVIVLTNASACLPTHQHYKLQPRVPSKLYQINTSCHS